MTAAELFAAKCAKLGLPDRLINDVDPSVDGLAPKLSGRHSQLAEKLWKAGYSIRLARVPSGRFFAATGSKGGNVATVDLDLLLLAEDPLKFMAEEVAAAAAYAQTDTEVA